MMNIQSTDIISLIKGTMCHLIAIRSIYYKNNGKNSCMIYDDICAMQAGLFCIYRHTDPLGFSWHYIKLQNGMIIKMSIYIHTDYKFG